MSFQRSKPLADSVTAIVDRNVLDFITQWASSNLTRCLKLQNSVTMDIWNRRHVGEPSSQPQWGLGRVLPTKKPWSCCESFRHRAAVGTML